MPNQTLYDNFSQVRQYIDQNQVDLSSYVSETELSNTLNSYLSVENLNTAGTKMWLRTNGLTVVSTTNSIAPKTLSYTDLVNNSTSNNWIGQTSLQNYVNGRLADIESTYATTSYVVDYVAEYGGGGSTTIDENIIPKETGTYTLGNASYYYSNTYTNRVNFGSDKVYIYNNGDTQMKFGVNNADRFRIDYNSFVPSISGAVTQLGTSNNPFTNTYTSNLYTPSLVLSYSYNSIDNASNTQINFKVNQFNRMKLTNTALMPSTNNGIKLGDSGAQWSTTYVRDLYLNGTNIKDSINGMFSYDSATGTLTITSL